MNQAGHRPPAGRGWFLGGYAGLAGFFGLELGLREGGAAASLDATSADQGTTAMIVGAFSAALILAPIVRRMPRTQLPALAGPTGLVIEGAGLAVRAWSMAELKASYTRTLRIRRESEPDRKRALPLPPPSRLPGLAAHLDGLRPGIREHPGHGPRRRPAGWRLPAADPGRGGAARTRAARLRRVCPPDLEADPRPLVARPGVRAGPGTARVPSAPSSVRVSDQLTKARQRVRSAGVRLAKFAP